jgi:hypothetical protein
MLTAADQMWGAEQYLNGWSIAAHYMDYIQL